MTNMEENGKPFQSNPSIIVINFFSPIRCQDYTEINSTFLNKQISKYFNLTCGFGLKICLKCKEGRVQVKCWAMQKSPYLRFCSPRNMCGLNLFRLFPFRWRVLRFIRLEKAPSWMKLMRLFPKWIRSRLEKFQKSERLSLWIKFPPRKSFRPLRGRGTSWDMLRKPFSLQLRVWPRSAMWRLQVQRMGQMIGMGGRVW